MGHDGINQYTCVNAECDRLGYARGCFHCAGDGVIWPSDKAREAYENWRRTDPPSGPGYQVWETVSEGSPISPVFADPLSLAQHMATTRWGADEGTSVEAWLRFIEGPGWAPSMIGMDGVVVDGVTGVACLDTRSAGQGGAP